MATVERISLAKLLTLLRPHDPQLVEIVAIGRNQLLLLNESGAISGVISIAGDDTTISVPPSSLDVLRRALEEEISDMREDLEPGKTELEIRLAALEKAVGAFARETRAASSAAESAGDTAGS